MMLVPPATFGARGTSLINTLRNLSLTSNLQVCLDAGDLNSYDGSSQTWSDLSGNGNHFYRGTGSGSDVADPTFTGTAGRMSSGDYFGYDGADRFTLAQSAPAWQSGMHKAGGKFTILQWAYVGNLTGLAPSQAGFGCGDGTSSGNAPDAVLFTNSGSVQNALSISTSNATVGVVGNRSTLLVTNNAWQMIAAAIDIDAQGVYFAVNGSFETRANASSGSPSTTDSHVPMVIGALDAAGGTAAINGCRIASTAIWTRVLSSTELGNIFTVTRPRFGV